MSEVGTVGSVDNASIINPTSDNTPSTGTSLPSQWVQGLAALNPTTAALSSLVGGGASSTLGNYALVAAGAILTLGALLISQKQIVVEAIA